MTIPTRRTREGGFTLIEMLTVLVIFGISAAIAAPSLSGFISGNKVDRARDQVIGDLAYSRMLAIRSAATVNVCLVNQTTYLIKRGASSVDCSGGTTVRTIRLGEDFPGVRIDETPPLVITFNSRGLASVPPDQIDIVGPGGKSQAFTMSAIGTVFRK
ncbi:N/A [soil metagenome]